MVTYW